MEQKQPLLFIVAMLVFGVSIASAIWIFGQNNITSHRDELRNDINHIAADAYQYKLRPSNLGGGSGSYTGYRIPAKLSQNTNGNFEVENSRDQLITIIATSSLNFGTIKAVLDSNGKLGTFSYSGEFIE